MPATTRSSGKQTALEDFGAGEHSKSKQPRSGSKKRKSDDKPKAEEQPVKKARKSSNKNVENDGEVITINRAPVLELWGSCVANFLYPTISWSTALSAGSSIATITAISKGRSIGMYEKPTPADAEERRQERKKKAEKEGLEELEVMSFKVNLDKDGQAMVGGKPKKASEEALIKKYGGPEQYEKVKKVFEQALASWKGKEQELDERAFGMYEDFRPSVPPGQKGWGRKGQLNLQNVRSAISG